MSAKVTYVLCGILFVILVALMVIERQYPEGGEVFLQSLFG